MPKKVTLNDPVEGDETVQVVGLLCGHINKQHYGPSGKLDDLDCTMPDGHNGNHSAPYKRKVGTPVTNEKGMVTSVTYEEVETTSSWRDAAGTPADQVYVGAVEQMTLYQRDLVLQIIHKNPKIAIDQAVVLASHSEEWKQGVQ